MTTVPQTAWERIADTAMKTAVRVFGDGLDANGVGQIQYTHVGGTAFFIDGIFEAVTEVVDPDTGFNVLSNQPMVSLPLSVLQQIPDQGDTLVIRGITYRVLKPEFDGQGSVSLRLHKT